MRLREFVAIGISILWAVSYIVAVISANYTGFQTASGVMLIAGAWLLAPNWRGNGQRRRRR